MMRLHKGSRGERAGRQRARFPPGLAGRLARAHVAGDARSAEAFRARLRAEGYDAHLISPDGLPDAVKAWAVIASRFRLAGLKPVLIVPIPTRADPLIFEPASNLRGGGEDFPARTLPAP